MLETHTAVLAKFSEERMSLNFPEDGCSKVSEALVLIYTYQSTWLRIAKYFTVYPVYMR